jgi:hypothetical protein
MSTEVLQSCLFLKHCCLSRLAFHSDFLSPLQATPHQGPALIAAPWPAAVAATDHAAGSQFEALQAAVRAVRNARAEYGVEPGRKIAATFRVASAELLAALAAEAPVLALLARLEPDQVHSCLLADLLAEGCIVFRASWPKACWKWCTGFVLSHRRQLMKDCCCLDYADILCERGGGSGADGAEGPD